MEAVLRSAVSRFSESPSRNGKIMRDLIAESSENFRAAAVSVMREPSDIRGCRHLVTVLWTHDLLIPILGDTAKSDPQLHSRLIRFLVTGMLEGKELPESSANRLLDMLSSMADTPGIHRFIREMLQHPSPRIRSKVTLLLERGGADIRALVALVEDPNEDARVRANAIESLWSVDSPELPALFKSFIGDSNNRVAGNAILALYRLGDRQAIPALFEMAASPDPLVQTTAVWTMGRTKDPRFLSCVGRFMLASKGMLRRTAFNALESIKKAAAERAKGPRLDLNILAVQAVGDAVLVRASLTYPASAKPVEASPTAFVLQVDSKLVVDFKCSKQQNAFLCVAFIIPIRGVVDPLRSKIDSALNLCLDSKTTTEQWNISRYQERGGTSQEIQSAFPAGQNAESNRSSASRTRPLAFSPNAVTIRASLDASTASRDTGFDGIDTMRSALASTLPPRAVRHAILVVDGGITLEDDATSQLIADAQAAKFTVSILSTTENSRLLRLCNETSGTFRVLPDADAVQSELLLIYASIRTQYVMEFPNSNPEGMLPQRVSLGVHAEGCGGEAVWERKCEPEAGADSTPPF